MHFSYVLEAKQLSRYQKLGYSVHTVKLHTAVTSTNADCDFSTATLLVFVGSRDRQFTCGYLWQGVTKITPVTNKFKGQRFICKLGFSPLASVYIYWNFRAKRTVMLYSCRAMIISLLHLVYSFYPNRQVRFRCLFPFDVSLCDPIIVVGSSL